MCSNVEDLRKELYVDDFLPALSSGPFQLENGRGGSDVVLAPLKGLLLLVAKGDPAPRYRVLWLGSVRVNLSGVGSQFQSLRIRVCVGRGGAFGC
jgi:hypothetical protein